MAEARDSSSRPQHQKPKKERRGGVSRARTKCAMCDFRRNKEKIQLANVSGCIFEVDGERQELDFVVGELSLEKNHNPLSYNVVIMVSGTDPNEDETVCTIAKFPTKICPNCGKVLK